MGGPGGLGHLCRHGRRVLYPRLGLDAGILRYFQTVGAMGIMVYSLLWVLQDLCHQP